MNGPSQMNEALSPNPKTWFFRDVHAFWALRDYVIPRLIEARRAEKSLRVWSAACGTGQEPLSVAMLLEDMRPELLDGWEVRIVASDHCAASLARARHGCYGPAEVNRGLPSRMLIRHFVQDGPRFRIRDSLRSRVELRELDLRRPRWPMLPAMDIILLCNVLAELPGGDRAMVLHRVARALRPGGALILGAGEQAPELSKVLRPRLLPGLVVHEAPVRGAADPSQAESPSRSTSRPRPRLHAVS